MRPWIRQRISLTPSPWLRLARTVAWTATALWPLAGHAELHQHIVVASADARVEEQNPDRSFGRAPLRVSSRPGRAAETLLCFDVPDVEGLVQQVQLQLFSQSAVADGPAVKLAEGGWSEADVTWNRRAPTLTEPVDDAERITRKSWVTFDVTPVVPTEGRYCFKLQQKAPGSVDFQSREQAHPPRLVIEYEDGKPKDDVAPGIFIVRPAGGVRVSGVVEVEAEATDDGSGLAAVVFRLGNRISKTVQAPPFRFTIDTRKLAYGSHQLGAEAVDKAGNRQADAVVFFVDNRKKKAPDLAEGEDAPAEDAPADDPPREEPPRAGGPEAPRPPLAPDRR